MQRLSLAYEIRRNLDLHQSRHEAAGDYYDFWYFATFFPTVGLAAAIPLIEVMPLEEEENGKEYKSMAIVCIGILNTLLIALSAMAGFQSRKDQHRASAKEFEQLIHTFDNQVLYPARNNSQAAESIITEHMPRVRGKTDDLVSKSPPVPQYVRKKFDNKEFAGGTGGGMRPMDGAMSPNYGGMTQNMGGMAQQNYQQNYDQNWSPPGAPSAPQNNAPALPLEDLAPPPPPQNTTGKLRAPPTPLGARAGDGDGSYDNGQATGTTGLPAAHSPASLSASTLPEVQKPHGRDPLPNTFQALG
jgi:hypothetical protein